MDKHSLSTFGAAAKELLSKTVASTIFKPSAPVKEEAPKSINTIIQAIKPPDFSSKGLNAYGNNSANLAGGSYKPTIPTINLPDFKNIIPSLKL
jgi:hypothetical protein